MCRLLGLPFFHARLLCPLLDFLLVCGTVVSCIWCDLLEFLCLLKACQHHEAVVWSLSWHCLVKGGVVLWSFFACMRHGNIMWQLTRLDLPLSYWHPMNSILVEDLEENRMRLTASEKEPIRKCLQAFRSLVLSSSGTKLPPVTEQPLRQSVLSSQSSVCVVFEQLLSSKVEHLLICPHPILSG